MPGAGIVTLMDTEAQAPVCYRHPDRITGLSCSECGRPICAECSHDAAVGQKCPNCAAPKHRTRVVTARDLQESGWRATPVSMGIIAAAVVVFLFTFGSNQLRRDLFLDFAQINVLVLNGEWWRVFSAGFLHDGIMHIGFNMYAVYLFGPRLEREAGSVPFALLYFASMAAGGAAFLLIGPEASIAVGASGAVFGLFGVWLAATYRIRNTPYGRAMFTQLMVLLAINLALPLFVPRVAWQAHAGGLAAGALIGFLWSKLAAGKPNAPAIRNGIAATVLAVSLAAILLA